MFLIYAALGVAGGLAYARVTAERAPVESKKGAALGPSRAIVYKMAALFSIDAFGGGFAVQSLVALWLFGKFGIVDAMFAPVALRLHTYAVPLDGPEKDYVHTVLHLPALR